MESSGKGVEIDEIDLLLLETLVRHPSATYKKIAQSLHLDQRTVAKRIKTLTEAGVMKQIVEVDWVKLGLGATAYIGATTAKGIGYAQKLNDLVRDEPRIVKGYETLGTNQYLVKVIDTDIYTLRDSVLRELDVFASELTVSLATKNLKEDYGALLRYLRETKYPRSRSRSELVPKRET